MFHQHVPCLRGKGQESIWTLKESGLEGAAPDCWLAPSCKVAAAAVLRQLQRARRQQPAVLLPVWPGLSSLWMANTWASLLELLRMIIYRDNPAHGPPGRGALAEPSRA